MHRTTIHYQKYSRSCRIYYGYSEVQVGSSSSRMSGDILNRIICYEERARFTVPRYNTNGNNIFLWHHHVTAWILFSTFVSECRIICTQTYCMVRFVKFPMKKECGTNLVFGGRGYVHVAKFFYWHCLSIVSVHIMSCIRYQWKSFMR